MLTQLSIDPALTQKRLGDGFYRTIELAIPPNPTPAQVLQLQRAADYAKQNNIQLNITKVK